MKKLLFALALAGTLLGQQGNTVFQNVYVGITTASHNSLPLRNIGNSGHLLWVLLVAQPTKTCSSPQTVNVGLESSFDNVTWTPAGAQVTSVTADANGNLVTTTTAQGAYPFMRVAVRSFDTTNCALSASYSGTVGSQSVINVTSAGAGG